MTTDAEYLLARIAALEKALLAVLHFLRKGTDRLDHHGRDHPLASVIDALDREKLAQNDLESLEVRASYRRRLPDAIATMHIPKE